MWHAVEIIGKDIDAEGHHALHPQAVSFCRVSLHVVPLFSFSPCVIACVDIAFHKVNTVENELVLNFKTITDDFESRFILCI